MDRAALVSLAVNRTSDLRLSGTDPAAVATGGFALFFGAAAGVVAAAALLDFFTARGKIGSRVEQDSPVGEL